MSAVARKVVRFFDNVANPILVKEIRQAVKGRFLIVILALILLIQLVMWWVFTLPINSRSETAGFDAFFGMINLFGYSLMFSMPLYTGWRILAERMNQDLLYVSALSPFQIIWGKFLSSAAIILIVFSTFLPFFYLTLLLGGINVLTITYTLTVLVIGLLLHVSVSILILCGSVPIFLRIIFILAFFIGNIYLGVLIWMSVYSMTETFIIPPSIQMMIFMNWVVLGTTGIGLFIVLSTCVISPAGSNRAVVPRIYVTAMIAVYVGFIYAIEYFFRNAGGGFAPGAPPGRNFYLEYGAALVFIFGGKAALIISVGGRTRYGLRLRNAIPKTTWKRILCFPFFSGAANGIFWSLSLVLVGFAIIGNILINPESMAGPYEVSFLLDTEYFNGGVYHLICFFNYVCIYSFLGVIMFQKTKRLHPFIWTIFLSGTVSFGTTLIYFSFYDGYGYSNSSDEWLFILLPNGPAFLTDELLVAAMYVSSVINFVLLAGLSSVLYFPQAKAFFTQENTGHNDVEKKDKKEVPMLASDGELISFESNSKSESPPAHPEEQE